MIVFDSVEGNCILMDRMVETAQGTEEGVTREGSGTSGCVLIFATWVIFEFKNLSRYFSKFKTFTGHSGNFP